MSIILVTDGEQRAALAVVRSLASAGHRVLVCSSRLSSLAGSSRHCRQQFVVPDPLQEPDAYVGAIRGLVEKWDVQVLVPITEASLLALLPERDAFPGVRIPFPAASTFARVCDKAAVMEVARSLGIGVPAQCRLESKEQARTCSFDGLRYPIVLKPSRSVVATHGARSKSAVLHVADAASLQRTLDSTPAAMYPLLLQERIVGPGIGVFLLIWKNEALASFAHRRIREKPPSGGVSVLRESYPLPADLLERSRALLQEFDWQGVAMVEYKLDDASRTPYLMEINGRFWGSLQLALDAGVDFPALLVAAASGEKVSSVNDYQLGVRTRWTWGEIDHLIARMRHSKQFLSLPDTAPGRAVAMLQFLAAFGPSCRDEIFRFKDPLPWLRETADWVRAR